MTPTEREKEEAWCRWAAEQEDAAGGFPTITGIVPFLAERYPIPDTAGMLPDEAEALMARWRAVAIAAYDAVHAQQPLPPADYLAPVPAATS